MNWRARAYIAATVIMAVFLTSKGLADGGFHGPLLFLGGLIVGIVGSAAKMRLPGVHGTMSAGFLVMLVATAKLSLMENIFIMASGSIVQCLWNSRTTPRLVQVLFSVANSIVATGVSHIIGHKLSEAFNGSMVPLLFGAAISYFALVSFPIAAILNLAEGRPLVSTWRETYFWSLPYFVLGAALVGTMLLLQKNEGWYSAAFVLPLVWAVYHGYGLYLGRLEAEKDHVEKMASLHLRTIESLALAIEAKEPNTQEHLRRMEVFAMEIAKELRLSDEDVKAVRAGALLHDIGKLAVPEHIVSKPGKLTPMEFERMKIHPVVGAEILAPVGFPYPVVEVVRHHHERWDGKGYPDGLSGNDIPVGARILAVVDAVDAMSTHRQYREAVSLDEAIKSIANDSGRAFDPKIVDILTRNYRDFEAVVRAGDARLGPVSAAVAKSKSTDPAGVDRPIPEAGPPQPAFDYRALIAEARQEAQILFELTRDLGTSLSLEDTLSVLASRLKKVVPHDAIAVFLVRDGALVPEHVSGENAKLLSSLRVPLGEGISGWVAAQGKPMLNGNPTVEAGYLNDPTQFTTLRSAISLPLDGLNSLVGVLTLYRTEKESFNMDHLRILQATSSKIALSIENALRFRQVATTAVTDALTALPNARSLFLQLEGELSQCRATNQTLAVIVCDLDGFKAVNDRFGHLEGNRVLREVAEALRHQCRESDYVARMGGDEFVVLIPSCPQPALDQRLQKMRAACVDVGMRLFGELTIDASFGVAQYPADADDSESLLAVADRRMYHVKEEHHANAPQPAAGRMPPPAGDAPAIIRSGETADSLDAMRRALK